jgi:cation:H+ antiporter
MLIVWIVIFLISLALCIKGADWLLESAEKLGIIIGLSPFIVGVLIVGLGTSFPELIVALAAVFQNVPEVPVASAIGSNIANILLVLGIAAIVGKKLVVTKSLIDLNLPLLAISTVLFLGIVWDGNVTFFEALILLATYSIYLVYMFKHKEEDDEDQKDIKEELDKKEKFKFIDIAKLLGGVLALALGSKYLVDSVINVSTILEISIGIITISAVAIGTSFPELLVSVKAALKNKPEVALGNIFGSNSFNMLVVVGLPGLFANLSMDEQTYMIGLPTMVIATLLFVISGISKRIYMWEGSLYLMIYILFMGKVFGLF